MAKLASKLSTNLVTEGAHTWVTRKTLVSVISNAFVGYIKAS